MKNTYESGASATPTPPPAVPSVGSPTDGVFGSVAPTNPGAYWFYMVTTELLNLLAAASVTPDHTVLTQVRDSIEALITSAIAAGFYDTGRHVLANPGYQRLPGGYIEQWGTLSGAAASVDTPVTLPIALDEVYSPSAVVLGSGGGAEVCKVKALTTTTITLTYLGSGSADIAWRVIGKKV